MNRKRINEILEQGWCFGWLPGLKGNKGLYEKLIKALREDADYTLPEGKYFEIRRRLSMDFGRNNGIAWLWNPLIAMRALKVDWGRFEKTGMYWLVARYRSRGRGK